MSDWKPYFGDRLRYDDPHGFVVIVPRDNEPVIPVFCPVCTLMMRTSDDAAYFREKCCCQKCGMKWADPDIERWNAGWRPHADEIAAEIQLRQSIPACSSG